MSSDRDVPAYDDRHLSLSFALPFLETLTESLLRHFKVDVAWIGDIDGHDTNRIRVLSISATSDIPHPGEYIIRGAPGAIVVEKGLSVAIPDVIFRDHSHVQYFVDNGIAGYCAVPLIGVAGAPVGILGVGAKHALEDVENIQAHLASVAPRTAHEVESLRLREKLSSLTRLSASKQSPDRVFRDLALNLAATFGSDMAFVTEFRDSPADSTRFLACVETRTNIDNQYGETLQIEGTPCALVRESGSAVIQTGLQQQYPGFPAWSSLEPAGYAGSAVYGTDGSALGHIAIASNRQVPLKTIESPLWTVFTLQTAACIERLRADRRQRSFDVAYAVNKRVRDRGVAASTLGHDIENMLAAISLSTELCGSVLEDNPSALEHIKISRRATEKASNLAAKLLRGTEPYEAAKTETNVAEYLSLLMPSFKAIADSSTDLTLMPIDRNLSFPVIQDELAQALLNLVENAVEACVPADGKVTISASTVFDLPPGSVIAGHLEPGSEYIYVSVSDTGCGIAPDRLSSILRSAVSTKAGGSGIGLLAVRDIVSRHSGVISIISELDNGTSVTIGWPIHAEDQAPASNSHRELEQSFDPACR